MSYSAIVAPIRVRPHPNADRLQLGICAGCQVVVGLDTVDGELGVFFPADGQLSEAFVFYNGLYTESARLKLGLENLPGQRFGFFSEKRRVRAQSFRGEKSDGFWVPLSNFNYLVETAAFPYKEGDQFTTINGEEVCQKYVTKATRQAGEANKVGRKQRENRCFPKHDVTKQFRFVGDKIPVDAVLYVTEKLHGTSGRFGLVLDDVPVSWWQRFLRWCVGDSSTPQVYRYLNGSKNVILEKTKGPGYYGTNEFRTKAVEGLTLHKGEILYFEIVGYVDSGRAIMPAHPIKDEVKSLRKAYGDAMHYTYGQVAPNSTIYVYRIVRVNEDGQTIELSWPQMVARCSELGLKHVPLLQGPFIAEPGALADLVEGLTDGPSTLDRSHIREGVVVRAESSAGVEFIKNKSWWFGVLEGYIKDSEDYVDEEESS